MVFYQNILLAGWVLAGWSLSAQVSLTEQQAIELALKNHPAIQAAGHYVQQQDVLKKGGVLWEPAQIFHNVAADPDWGMFGTSALGVQQNFPSGRLNRAIRGYHANLQAQAEARQGMMRQEIVRQVREIYYHLGYLDGKSAFVLRLDSVYQRVARAADLRHSAGDIPLAEKLAVRDKAAQVRLEALTIQHEIEFDRIVLGQILGLKEPVQPIVGQLYEGEFSITDTSLLRTSALARFGEAAREVARSEQELAAARSAPSVSAGLFAQYLANGDVFPGWQVGLNVPIFRKSLKAQSEAATVGIAAADAEYRLTLLQQQTQLGHRLHEQEKYRIMLAYYATEGRELAAELLRAGELNYLQGELGFPGFAQLLEQATAIEMQYLENLLGLNLTIIEMEALVGSY